MALSLSRVASAVFAKCTLRYAQAFQENVNGDSYPCKNLFTLMTFLKNVCFAIIVNVWPYV